MMDNIVFSIIIPTYNSSSTLSKTLKSIANQSFPKEKIEVLIVDGGSTDETVSIAKSFDFVKILDNPEKLPEYAKMHGIQNAKGQYIIKMDSDEEFVCSEALSSRFVAFNKNPDHHLLVADKLLTPKDIGKKYIASPYINAVGDPFSYFIYHSKDGIINSFKYNITNENDDIVSLSFEESDKRPIADGGTTTFDLFYIRHHSLLDLNVVENISSISDKIMDKSKYCLCIKGDDVIHNSFVTFGDYIKKLKFRVINNVFQSKDSGFSNRKISKNNKKYWFPLYAISLLFPIIDAVKLSLMYKNIAFLMHPIYCLITLFFIAKYTVLKLFGKNIRNKEY